MRAERDRGWYREQIEMLEQEIDRIQVGHIRPGDRSLGQCLADMEMFTRALADIEDGPRAPASQRGFH